MLVRQFVDQTGAQIIMYVECDSIPHHMIGIKYYFLLYCTSLMTECAVVVKIYCEGLMSIVFYYRNIMSPKRVVC